MSRKRITPPAPKPGEPFTVTIQNRRNFMVELHLTDDCADPEQDLPILSGIKAEQVYNEQEMHRPPVTVFRSAKFAPTLTLLAKEKREGLPSAVADADSVVGAAARGEILVSKVAIQAIDPTTAPVLEVAKSAEKAAPAQPKAEVKTPDQDAKSEPKPEVQADAAKEVESRKPRGK